jgi:DNA integrity scanning protein DisA with diadenylate cyclase activity
MSPFRLTDSFRNLLRAAGELAVKESAEAILVLVDGSADWPRLKSSAESVLEEQSGDSSQKPRFLVAVSSTKHLEEVQKAGLAGVSVPLENLPIHDRITQALLEAVADDLVAAHATVIVLYSGFEPDVVDSLTIVDLSERLRRFTGRDLRGLESVVPLPVLRTVVDLALEIGREGREGKPVGTIFVVGDVRRVLSLSHPINFDPVRGYSRRERNLLDSRVREAIKEIAQLDGAIIVAPDGTVESACRIIDAPATNITLSKGLGARHWAAAAITRATKAIAVTVSESTGTVRIFQNGEVIRRIEPSVRRPLVWREVEWEPPIATHQTIEPKTESKVDPKPDDSPAVARASPKEDS